MHTQAIPFAPVLSVAIPVLLLAVRVSAQLPAFPGADGAGQYATGGRGGVVYHVTTLDRNYSDSRPGTLRYGLDDLNFTNKVRTIVFDIGGAFWLGRANTDSNGWDASSSRYNFPANVTIAGQTAPGPVYIMGGVSKPSKTNLIIRNISFAPGYGVRGFQENPSLPPTGILPTSYVYDAMDISGQNIMIDHASVFYATDEAISCNELANHLTIQYCNSSQGQNYNGHAYGHLLQAGSNCKISLLNCLDAHQKSRIPRVGSEVGTGAWNDFRNNVFYNWLGNGGYAGASQYSFNNFIQNFYLAGPGGDASYTNAAAGSTNIFDGASATYTKVYADGNRKDINNDGDSYDDVATTASSSSSTAYDFRSVDVQTAAYDVNIGVTLSARSALTNVLRYVGARWWERDYDFTLDNTNAINTPDERIIRETWTGTGRIMAWADDPFNSDPSEGVEWRSLLALRADPATGAAPYNRGAGWDTDGDGIPDYWELEHGLNPNVANNNGDFDSDGYTDLEEYLNDVAVWPAPGEVYFTGATNNRYALIYNWQVRGASVNITNLGVVTTASRWQPSRYDTGIISNATVVVDAVGQRAGTLRLRDNGVLNLSSGWLKASNTVEIATAGSGTLNLSGGRLRVGTLAMGGGSGVFNFTGGTLSADVVSFNMADQGGEISPGEGVGQAHVTGNLTLGGGSSVAMELGGSGAGQSDLIMVDGNLGLGGTLNVTNVAGFGPGTYTLMTYGGTLSGTLIIGARPAGYNYTIDTSTPGQVRLVVVDPSAVVEPPEFESVQLVGTNLVVGGSGPTNGVYYVLTTTNLSLPMSQWPAEATNVCDGAGRFSITNAVEAGKPQKFFRLQLP
jgi:hypothetical protein